MPAPAEPFTTAIVAAAGQRQFHGDRRACAPAPSSTMRLPCGSVTPASDSRKPLPSVFSPTSFCPSRMMQLTAPIKAGRLAEPVEIGQHRHLVRLGDVRPAESQGADATDGVPQILWRDFQRDVPPIETVMDEQLLHHVLGRIAGHTLAKQHTDLLQNRFIHV